MRTGGACSAIPKPGRREDYWIRARNALLLLPKSCPLMHGAFSYVPFWCFYYGLKSFAELAWFLFFGSLLQRLGSLLSSLGQDELHLVPTTSPRSLRFRLVIDIRVPDTNLGIPFSKPRIPTYNRSGRNYCLQLEQNEIHDNSSINETASSEFLIFA